MDWDRTKDAGNCIEWVGGTQSRGYGMESKGMLAHRAAYLAYYGELPKGLVIDHLCENKVCCNPLHLEAVTNGENLRRHWSKKTHCVHGHLLDGDNVYIRPDTGRRECRACRRKN